ncbi:hypothetical protein P9112_014067 [Eukaryota sp. TZLM1-RC]
MPWMGLERTKEPIEDDLNQISMLRNILTDVSFEKYDLDWDANLKNNGFSDVNPIIQRFGLGAHPMITTVNIPKLTELFSSTSQMDKFIDQFITVALRNNYTGANIDFEPSGKEAFPLADGLATFLDRFAKALHKYDMVLSVDVAAWTQFFNYEKIANSAVDYVCDMSTYAGNFNTFLKALDRTVNAFGPKACVGLMTINPNDGKHYTDEELKMRFDAIKERNVDFISIWQMPIPGNWVNFLADFVRA